MKQTADSERRHVFRSFKDRVDSIKIEPARNLSVRAHDYVESSHFASTLSHWKEINISGVFTDFVFEVDKLCQTLPQLLHHQTTLYEQLSNHIAKHDINSLQPLLELMSQFIHDLGEDFMPYYGRFLRLIIDLAVHTSPNDAQNMRNASNCLEWCFNTLAYGFKYLSRTLLKDLRPTFLELSPILQATKKPYLSRFCAEALSFLVKKLNPESLEQLVELSINSNTSTLEKNGQYRETLALLYVEAMKNTKQTFHSKSLVIFTSLLNNLLSSSSSQSVKVALFIDIVLKIMEHGSQQSCQSFVERCLTSLSESCDRSPNTDQLHSIVSVLEAFCFGQGGNAISSWDAFFALLDKIMRVYQESEMFEDPACDRFFVPFSRLIFLAVRNSDYKSMMKSWERIMTFFLHQRRKKFFLGFYALCIQNIESKVATFDIHKYFRSCAAETETEDDLEILSYILYSLRADHSHELSKVTIKRSVSRIMINFIETELTRNDQISWSAIIWRCQILQVAGELEVTNVFRALQSLKPASDATAYEGFGLLMAICVSNSSSSDLDPSEVASLCFSKMEELRTSSEFIRAVIKLLESMEALRKLLQPTEYDRIVRIVAKNFSLPSAVSRLQSMELVVLLANTFSQPTPKFVSQMQLIDGIPLDILNANEVKMRIRRLGDMVCAEKNFTETESILLFHFLIGQLSNHFQPSWIAVYEALPIVAGASSSQNLWEILLASLRGNHDMHHDLQIDDPTLSDLASSSLPDSFEEFESSNEAFQKFVVSSQSSLIYEGSKSISRLLDAVKRNLSASSFQPLLRARILKAIETVGFLAERNGESLVELTFHVFETARDTNKEVTFNSKEKRLLFKVFGKFRRMSKLKNNDKLYCLVLEEISSKQTEVQREALDLLFVWNRPEVNKYRDNLKNLLDDKLFKDELQTLIAEDDSSLVAVSDRQFIFPIILRMLYGRAKGASNNSGKTTRKSVISSVLPNLPPEFVQDFLGLLSRDLKFSKLIEADTLETPSKQTLSRIMGYLNMLTEVYNAMGVKFSKVLSISLQPLLFCLLSSQRAIDSDLSDAIYMKSAKAVRQNGFKCLNQLMHLAPNDENYKNHLPVIYHAIIKPRLPKFSQENLQQPSSLLQIMLGWISSPNLLELFYFDEFAPLKVVMALLDSPHAKESVQSPILDFCIAALTLKGFESENFFTALALVVDGSLTALPRIIEQSMDKDLNARSSALLLLLVEGALVKSQDLIKALLSACAVALEKPAIQIGVKDKVTLLLSLTSLVQDFDCDFDEVRPLYFACSKCLKLFKFRELRESVVELFGVLGAKFPMFKVTADLLKELNAYEPTRLDEPDFQKRQAAFKLINDSLYQTFEVLHWTPILLSCLFFINDPIERSIRSNATFTINRFIETVSTHADGSNGDLIHLFRELLLPALKIGIKKKDDQIKEGYIRILAQCIKQSDVLDEFSGMKVLISEDPDVDFFENFVHIQVRRRQEAIRRLREVRSDLDPESIFHYIIPMTESLIECEDESLRNLSNDTHDTWAALARCMNWDQFRQCFKRCLTSIAKAEGSFLKERVHLAVKLSSALYVSSQNIKNDEKTDRMQKLPDETKLESIIQNDFIEPMMKVVRIRDDDTIVQRTPLIEAAIYSLLSMSETSTASIISSVLTSTCQALRSRTQHIRDAVRKSLAKVARIVGPKYLKFIVKELKTALSRGAQIHVLSYTTHTVLAATKDAFESGDLDEVAPLIADIIMEDTFGAAGQEKDSEGYVSKMREVHSKMSFEIVELLAANISLPSFHDLVEPIKLLASQNLPMKTRRKLDELITRYSTGLKRNEHSCTTEILILCYELHKQSNTVARDSNDVKKSKRHEHYLIDLNARPDVMRHDSAQVQCVLQKLAFEILRSALQRNKHLLTSLNLDGFIPLMDISLLQLDENLLISVFKFLDLIAKLEFSEARDEFFRRTIAKAFEIIQNMPSTSNELCQISLRYLSSIIKLKPSIEFEDKAIAYLLVRILPDLEEHEKQALAFQFLKCVISRRIKLPEVYDIMDKVLKIMVVNHSADIRNMSRGIYFQFLMEYEQGPIRLENSLKFLIDNLSYPTESGRQAVMEFMHLVVVKAPQSLLDNVCISFFLGLAHVCVSDDSSKCRELASTLLKELFKHSKSKFDAIDKYCLQWLRSDHKPLLKRCGLVMFRLQLEEFGQEVNNSLASEVLSIVHEVLKSSQNHNESYNATWEDLYTCLSIFYSIQTRLDSLSTTALCQKIWDAVPSALLYPHPWVRLSSARLINMQLQDLDSGNASLEPQLVQTIAYRLLRQLSAPTISSEEANAAVKGLSKIITHWENTKTPFIQHNFDDNTEGTRFVLATDFILSRVCSLLRQEEHTTKSQIAGTAAIQLGASIIQICDGERSPTIARDLMLSMYNLLGLEGDDSELQALARDLAKLIETKLGTLNYNEMMSSVQVAVQNRRQDRKAKRMQMAVTAPDVAARRKLKKHERFRQKRKELKDENGYYKPKKRKVI